MPPKKLVGIKGKIIHSQGRQIIKNVAAFMQAEAEDGIQIPLKNHRDRTLKATGASRSTYARIKKEASAIETGASTSFGSPRKTRPRKKPVLGALKLVELERIRDIIYDFYILEKRAPSLKCILHKVQTVLPEFTGSKTSLWRLLKIMGFRWQRTQDNRKMIMESYDIRLKRINFLENIIKYRTKGWNIIYTDETYIHSSHVQSKGWYDISGKGLKKPISKGRRLVIVHAGGEKGFIPNALLIFRSGSKSGDYHDDMNHSNFMKWVQEHLLPNMPEKSVLVVDNASYHNVKTDKNITSASKKSEMLEWLRVHKVVHDENKTKPALYELIKTFRLGIPVSYKLDCLLKEHGHKVLRLPPYHPEFNPIEKIWALVKNWVAVHNTTFKLDDVEKLARKKFSEVSVQEWFSICEHVRKCESEWIKKEHILDDAIDSLVFTVNTGSSDESTSEDDCSSDSSMSNIELLSDSESD